MEAEAKARPEVPSATQGVEAADQPVGRFVFLVVRSEDKVERAAFETNRVKALGPPQMALAPEHCMVHCCEGMLSEAPLERTEPQ